MCGPASLGFMDMGFEVCTTGDVVYQHGPGEGLADGEMLQRDAAASSAPGAPWDAPLISQP